MDIDKIIEIAVNAGAKPVDWDVIGKPIYSWDCGWADMDKSWLQRLSDGIIENNSEVSRITTDFKL